MINTKRNRKKLFLELEKKDWITKLKKLLEHQGGYWLRIEDGKFVPRFPVVAWDAPWVYVKPDPKARCDIYQRVFFQVLNHIHSHCRDCWKVVVRPRNLVELFDLYELQKEMDVPCKCGLEVRETVNGLYGGYFYNRGKSQGLERYKQVRSLVNKHLSKTTPVILKRYCTEFEIGPGSLGPSDKTKEITFEEREMEKEVESLIPRVGFGTVQPDWITARTLKEWIVFAYKNGDQAYKEFTDGNKLFPDYVTYHTEEKNG